MRIKFRSGYQRKFLQKVLENINCPSLRELRNRGIDVSYPTLKNYFSERRNLSEELFNDLCLLSKIEKSDLDFKLLDENFGQKIGGQKSRKS